MSGATKGRLSVRIASRTRVSRRPVAERPARMGTGEIGFLEAARLHQRDSDGVTKNQRVQRRCRPDRP